ncbi:MAG: YdcF family protein [Anaerolineae bacterium]|nr:YdcF family protein [Anaerolineae bacterium]
MLGEQGQYATQSTMEERRGFSAEKLFRRLIIAAIMLLTGAVAFAFLWNEWVQWRYQRHITSVSEAGPERVAVIFGAAVYGNGRLSAMLQDRVRTGVELYQSGRVEKLLMTGDNSSEFYNEPLAMMAYANALGVPYEDMQPDYGGRRTYDSCYRAEAIFGLDTTILVTQAFHLPRALFTCRALGIDAVGVVADRRTYNERSLRWSETREFVAILAALRDVILHQPPPVLGDPIPIE